LLDFSNRWVLLKWDEPRYSWILAFFLIDYQL